MVWSSTPINAALVDANYLPRTTDVFLSAIPSAAFVRRDLALTGLGETGDGVKYGKLPRILALAWPYPIVALVLYNKTGNDATSDLIYYSSDAVGMPFNPRGLNWEVQFNQVRRGFFRITSLAAPSTPTLSGNLVLNDMGLSWTASTPASGDSISQYQIFRQVDGGGYTLLTTVPVASPRTYTDAGLAGGHTYNYYVVADAMVAGPSGNSNVVTASPSVAEFFIIMGVTNSAYSGDGVTWTAGGSFSSSAIFRTQVAYEPSSGRWLGVGGAGAGDTVYSDNNGVSWTPQTSGTGVNQEGLATAYSAFFMGSNNATLEKSTTALAGSWTNKITNRCYDVQSVPSLGMVIACGTPIGTGVATAYSTDGNTFSQGSVTGLTSNTLHDRGVAVGYDATRGKFFLAVYNDSTLATTIYTTTDFVSGTWTSVGTIAASAQDGFSGCRFAFKSGGNGQPICLSTGGTKFWVSTDNGANWSWPSDTSPATISASGVIWSDYVALFIAVRGTILVTSPDAVTWTRRTVPGINIYSCIGKRTL
jgi:hypothetical protein